MEQSLTIGFRETRSKPRRLWWIGKTLKVLIFAAPVLASNLILAQIAPTLAARSPYQTVTIDWARIPLTFLILTVGILVCYPIVHSISALVTYLFARFLRGKGSYWEHNYELAVTHRNIALLSLPLVGLMLVTIWAGVLCVIIPIAYLRWVSNAIADVHCFSSKRGYVATLGSVLVPIIVFVLFV